MIPLNLGSKRPPEGLLESQPPFKRRRLNGMEPEPQPVPDRRQAQLDLVVAQLVQQRLQQQFPAPPRPLRYLWPHQQTFHPILQLLVDRNQILLAESCAQLAGIAEREAPLWIPSVLEPLFFLATRIEPDSALELVALATDALTQGDPTCLLILKENPLDQWPSILKEDFRQRIDRDIQQIQDQLKVWNSFHFQTPSVLPARLLPLLLTRHLLPREGVVNSGLGPLLIEALRLDHDKASRWRRYDAHLMRHISSSPRFREVLRKIRAPHKTLPKPQKLIRRALFLEEGEPVNRLHAQQTVLSTLLSHLYQRSTTGSCAGTATGLFLLSECPDLILTDLKALVEDGYMSRLVHGEHNRYPLCLELSPDDLHTAKPASRELWKLPSLQAAGSEAGFPVTEYSVSQALDRLGSPATVSAMDLMTTLIIQAGHEDPHEERLHAAIFAYENFTTHPLLRAWESAILSMGKHSSSFGEDLSKLLVYPLVDLAFQEIEEGEQAQAFLETFLSEFRYRVAEQSRYLFTPCYRVKRNLADKSAFVLHHTHGSRDPNQWTAIKNPDSFRVYVLQLAEEALEDMPPPQSEEERSFYLEASSKIRKVLTEEEFFLRCQAMTLTGTVTTAANILEAMNLEDEGQDETRQALFSNENMHKASHTPFQEFPFTPWSWPGSSMALVVASYFQSYRHLKRALEPFGGNAYQVLEHLTHYLREFSQDRKEKMRNHPLALIPVNHTHHVLNLCPGHPQFRALWDSGLEVEEWIKTHLEDPVITISTHSPAPETREAWVQKVLEQVRPEDRQDFLEAVSLLPKDLSCRHLRNALVTLLFPVRRADSLTPTDCGEVVDICLFHTLPAEQRDSLQQHSVAIAHLNYGGVEFGEYLSIALNPGTGHLAFWEALDNGELQFIADSRNLKEKWTLEDRIEME